MKRIVPDAHQAMATTIQGQRVTFWYLISPADPEAGAGFDVPYMESCYVTDEFDQRLDVPQDEIDKLIDLAFNQKDEP